MIGPWEHTDGDVRTVIVSPRLKALGPVANSPVNELMLAWFDHVLKGKDNGVSTGPRVDYFEMGENKWHTSRSGRCEPRNIRNWYLASGGHAASVMGDGALSTVAPGVATAHAAANAQVG